MSNESGKSFKKRNGAGSAEEKNTTGEHEAQGSEKTNKSSHDTRSASIMAPTASEMLLRHAREAEARSNSRLLTLTQEYLGQKEAILKAEAFAEQLSEELNRKENQIEQLETESAKQSDELRRAETSAFEMLNALSELKERNAYQSVEIDRMKKRGESLEKQTAETTAQLNCERYELSTQRDQAVAELERFRAEANATHEKIQANILSTANESFDKMLAEAEAKLVATTKTFEAQIAAQTTEFTEKQNEFQRKIAKVSDESWAKDLEIDRLAKSEKQYVEQVAGLNQQYAETLVAHTREIRDNAANFDDEKRTLVSERAQALAELQELRRDRDQFSLVREEFKEEIKHLKTQLKGETELLQTARNQLALQQMQLHHAQLESERQIAAVRHEYDLKIAGKVNEFQATREAASLEVSRANQRLEMENERLKGVETRLAQSRREHEQALAQVLELRETVFAARHSVADVESAMADSERRCSDLNIELTVMKDEMKRERSSVRELETDLRREVGKRSAAELETQLSEKRVQSLLADITRFNEKAVEFELTTIRKDETIQELELSLQSEQARNAKLEADRQARVVALAAMEKQLHKSEERMETANRQSSTWQAEVDRLKTEISGREEARVLRERTWKDRLRVLTQGLSRERDAFSGKVAELESKEKQLKASFAETEEARKETYNFQVETDRLQQEIKGFDRIRTIRERTWKDRLRVVTQSIAEERAEVAAHVSTIETISKDLEAANAMTKEMQGDIDRLRNEFTAAEKAHVAREATWKQRLRVLGNGLATDREALDERTSKLGSREQQLRLYASSMTKEKSELTSFTLDLARELKTIASTHPLKDYIAATEFELSKVEVQLKTTPMVAPDRPKLESAVGQLVEQREFLRGILTHAQKQFEQRAAALEKRAAGGFLAAVPPPPPVKGKAKAKPKMTSASRESFVSTPVPVKTEGQTPTEGPATDNPMTVRWASPLSDLE